MIAVLCGCSYSWCQSKGDTASLFSTGEELPDSVLVAIKDIRVANVKMIELKYEKENNRYLRGLIQTDSILIDALSTNLAACKVNSEIEIAKVKKQRNIAIGTGSGSSLLFLVLLLLAL